MAMRYNGNGMKRILADADGNEPLPMTDNPSSRLIYGCMRLVDNAGDRDGNAREKGKRALHAAIEAGYTQFDHADIYGGGECEALMGEVLRESPSMREQISIITKCGIRRAGDPAAHSPARYDFSAAHIRNSVQGSLQRLGIERIDLLLLHRPDYLGNPQEIAAALQGLQQAGSVARFGVSNFAPAQVDTLQAAMNEPLCVNQLEINLHNISALSDGTLEQCMRLGITPQAWCPLATVAYPAWNNRFTAEHEQRIRAELRRQSAIYGVADWIVVLAWLLRHPAGIAPIIGSTTPARIREAQQALAVQYEREDWYRLLEARNGERVP